MKRKESDCLREVEKDFSNAWTQSVFSGRSVSGGHMEFEDLEIDPFKTFPDNISKVLHGFT